MKIKIYLSTLEWEDFSGWFEKNVAPLNVYDNPCVLQIGIFSEQKKLYFIMNIFVVVAAKTTL